jgi:AbrB family looped-hinge helix DNA binding protein
MTYQTTITQKGQITIPKAVRDSLGLKSNASVVIQLDPQGQTATIRPSTDFLEVATRLSKKVTVKTDVLKARAYMETHYNDAL